MWISKNVGSFLRSYVLEASLSVRFVYPVLQAVFIFSFGRARFGEVFLVFLGEATSRLLVISFCIGGTHSCLFVVQMLAMV